MPEWGFEMIWKLSGQQLWMSIKSNLYNLIIMILSYLAPCCSILSGTKGVAGAFPTLQQSILYFMPLTIAIYLGKGGSKKIILQLMNHNPKPLQVTKISFWRLAPVKRRCTKKLYCRFQQNKRDMYGCPWWESIVFHHSWHVRIGVSWWGFASIGRLFASAFSLSLISS